MRDVQNDAQSRLPRAEPFTVELTFQVVAPVPDLDLSVVVQNLRGVRLLDEAWSDTAPTPRGVPGRYTARLRVPPVLNVGDYNVGVWIGTQYETFAWEDQAVSFRLEGATQNRPERVMQLGLRWSVQRNDP